MNHAKYKVYNNQCQNFFQIKFHLLFMLRQISFKWIPFFTADWQKTIFQHMYQFFKQIPFLEGFAASEFCNINTNTLEEPGVSKATSLLCLYAEAHVSNHKNPD